MSSIGWVVKNCAGIRRNLPAPARCFRCVFQGSSADRTRWHRSLLSPSSSTPFPELSCCNLPSSFLLSFFLRFLRSSFSHPASRGKCRIAGSPVLRSFQVSPWLKPREAPERSHGIRTHRAERQHQPVPPYRPSLRIL